MSKKTNAEVADIIANEGIGYAIQSYLGADHIEDPVLAAMWSEAEVKLNQIEAYLMPFQDEDYADQVVP